MLLTNILLTISFSITFALLSLMYLRLKRLQYQQEKALSTMHMNYYQEVVNELKAQQVSKPNAPHPKEVIQEVVIDSTKLLKEGEASLFLKQAVEIVNQYLNDSSFSVDLFCRELGISRAQLYRKMKAVTGQSVKEFIREIRIQKAGYLLQNTELSVKEVMHQVGFTNRQYFTKCFKEYFNEIPSHHRKQELV